MSEYLSVLRISVELLGVAVLVWKFAAKGQKIIDAIKGNTQANDRQTEALNGIKDEILDNRNEIKQVKTIVNNHDTRLTVLEKYNHYDMN